MTITFFEIFIQFKNYKKCLSDRDKKIVFQINLHPHFYCNLLTTNIIL